MSATPIYDQKGAKEASMTISSRAGSVVASLFTIVMVTV